MKPKVVAFTCTHSPHLPELLLKLNCSLALSTYQAGKVILISAPDRNHLIQLPRTFQKPTGIATDNARLAVATQTEVVVFNNASSMAPNYPKQPGTYDALFRATCDRDSAGENGLRLSHIETIGRKKTTSGISP